MASCSRPERLALPAALLVCGAASGATNHVVVADGMTFTPSEQTIVQGDSVTFINAGGVHNVRADDNSFWCADDCSLHRSPSANAWSQTIEFDFVRTIGYYCEQHGTPPIGAKPGTGMRGTIIVVADSVFENGFDIVP